MHLIVVRHLTLVTTLGRRDNHNTTQIQTQNTTYYTYMLHKIQNTRRECSTMRKGSVATQSAVSAKSRKWHHHPNGSRYPTKLTQNVSVDIVLVDGWQFVETQFRTATKWILDDVFSEQDFRFCAFFHFRHFQKN